MRPSKKNEIVEKALDIFYREGFHATGMDRLVAETGISKTSMYKHFKTKNDLIVATLKLRDDRFIEMVKTAMDGKTGENSLLAMFDWLDQWMSSAEFRSCMFIKASGEYPDHDDPIHIQSADHKRRLYKLVHGYVRTAGLKDAAKLTRSLLLLKEGAIVTMHLGVNPSAGKDAKQVAKLLIEAHRN